MTNRLRFRLLLAKLLLPFVYAGFFVVQLFINFDTSLVQQADRYQVINSRQTAVHPVSLEKSGNQLPVKTKFRLNKSFQPAVVPNLAVFVCNPVALLSTRIQFLWNQPFITHSGLLNSLLRGPPVA